MGTTRNGLEEVCESASTAEKGLHRSFNERVPTLAANPKNSEGRAHTLAPHLGGVLGWHRALEKRVRGGAAKEKALSGQVGALSSDIADLRTVSETRRGQVNGRGRLIERILRTIDGAKVFRHRSVPDDRF